MLLRGTGWAPSAGVGMALYPGGEAVAPTPCGPCRGGVAEVARVLGSGAVRSRRPGPGSQELSREAGDGTRLGQASRSPRLSDFTQKNTSSVTRSSM